MNLTLEHQVRVRAYELWLDGGMLPGRDIEYWCAAEREVLQQRSIETKDPVAIRAAARKAAASKLASPKTPVPGIIATAKRGASRSKKK